MIDKKIATYREASRDAEIESLLGTIRNQEAQIQRFNEKKSRKPRNPRPYLMFAWAVATSACAGLFCQLHSGWSCFFFCMTITCFCFGMRAWEAKNAE
jgi:hypothetical protein